MELLGVRRTVELLPAMQRGEFEQAIQQGGGRSLESIRTEWLVARGLSPAR